MYYPKINGLYKRYTEGPKKGRFIMGQYSEPEFEYLANNQWYFKEKMDGTNTIIKWDAANDEVTFHGRTARSVLPKPLLAGYVEKYTPELLRKTFGDTDALVYAEGVGPNIQSVGDLYGATQHAVILDVRIGQWWLEPESVSEVAWTLGTEKAPYVGDGTIQDAIEWVKEGFYSQWNSTKRAEGLVIRPIGDLHNRAGNRITTKIKYVDFKETQ